MAFICLTGLLLYYKWFVTRESHKKFKGGFLQGNLEGEPMSLSHINTHTYIYTHIHTHTHIHACCTDTRLYKNTNEKHRIIIRNLLLNIIVEEQEFLVLDFVETY